MQSAKIAAVRIDPDGRLCVVPEGVSFPLVYRAAMEVQWSDEGGFLYSPRPREWSYQQWFQQILSAVKDEYGYNLLPTSLTRWSDIAPHLKDAMIKATASNET